jgi:hydroxyethylthiazole kinase-like uncharacterized protein yjeF
VAVDERLHPDGFWTRLAQALEQVPREARTAPEHARVGAVLVLLEDTPQGPRVVLTRRRRDLRSHPGQISFPGGRLDPGESVEQAALREAHEEVGLRSETVEVIGAGPRFYIPPSRFWVVPVLARWIRPHTLTENPWEVDEVLRVPLTQLLDRDRWRHAPLSTGSSTWAWQLDDDLLWGATAVVMSTLLDVAVEGWNAGAEPGDLGDALAVRPWETAPSWQRRPRLEGAVPAVAQTAVPHVTAEQVRAARIWGDRHGVDAAIRAEHAGRALTHAVRRLLGGTAGGSTVTVLAGPSSNGAGGLAAARLLTNAGADVRVMLVGDPLIPGQAEGVSAAGVTVTAVQDGDWSSAERPGAVVIDAMLGIGADPPLRDLPGQAASWLRRYDVPVVALDLPSGVGPDVGLGGTCVTADVTVAMGRPTVALDARIVQPYLGDLYLADSGLPEAAWIAVGAPPVATSLFAEGPLVRLTAEEQATDAGTPDQADATPGGVTST